VIRAIKEEFFMLLIETKKINKVIGARELLKDICFSIYKGDKIGFVGRNGTGKSTLLKIILGHDQDFQGELNIKTQAGYLPQFYDYQDEQSVEGFFTEVSYDYGNILRLIKEFGFKTNILDRCINDCSGGEQTRLQLIRALIDEPDLLILDEPTNHLDIETRDWLAGFLREYQGGLLLVSHDRYFLDQVVEEIWDLETGEIQKYSGNFSEYRKLKEIELEKERQEYEKYQAEKKRLRESMSKQQQFVNTADKGRKRTDSFWKEMKGADRRTGRMAKRVKTLQNQIKKLDKKEKPFEYKEINPEFVGRKLHSQYVIQGKGISKVFQGKKIFEELSFSIARDSKIALIGRNGIGKTVLLKIIQGEEKASAGEVFRARELEIGYFSQKLSKLCLDNTILREVKEQLPERIEEEIRTFLGSMLFRGEEVFKKIGDLSIGERVRVALSILLMSKANFLLLDEPLNHLDIFSRERVEEALKNYPGAFLIVTHDRYFVKKAVNEIWELSTNGIECFNGNYEDFLKYRNGDRIENKLEDSLVKMKRAELIALLEEARDENEIERINSELDQLNPKKI